MIGEGDGYLDVPVTLSAPATAAVTVNYSTANATASGGCGGGGDYVALSGGCSTGGYLTFAPGQTTKTIRVEITNDATVEGQESFSLVLSGATVATIARSTTRVTIIDNDNLVATPQLYVRNAIVDATAGTVTIPVLMGGPSGQASANIVTVPFATGDVTATAGTDYTATSGTLTFNPGETVENIVVPLTGNPGAAPTRSFRVVLLAGATHATVADFIGIVTIGAHGATALASPSLSLAPDLVIGEGDGYLDVPVTLSAPATAAVTVNYSTANATASGGCGGGGDYVALSGGCSTGGYLTFAPGQTTKTIRVEILDDLTPEGQESFSLVLSGATVAIIARSTTRVTIIDNDNLVATPQLYVRSAIVDATAGTVTIPVLMGGPSGQASTSIITVNYATADGSAAPAPTTCPTSAPSPSTPARPSRTSSSPWVAASWPRQPEASRSACPRPTNATIADGSGTVTIGAHGATPVASPAISAGPDAGVGENDGYIDVPVTLSAPATAAVTVNYSTANVTAAGYLRRRSRQRLRGLVRRMQHRRRTSPSPPAKTTKTIRVEITNDLVPESPETFPLDAQPPTAATIARATTTVTIVDDDNLAAPPPP